MWCHRLSDEILDELLDSAVNELDEFCEQYAHDVFASEFAIPDVYNWFVQDSEFLIVVFNKWKYKFSRQIIFRF